MNEKQLADAALLRLWHAEQMLNKLKRFKDGTQ